MHERTSTFDDALVYASSLHRDQRRKRPASSGAIDVGQPVPYVGHLLGVASIVIDAGGDRTEAIGALLHDAAEDRGGEARLADIRDRFDARVADIVRGRSDSLTADPRRKAPWREREERYIAHLAASDDESVSLISAADKRHNAGATARDLAFASQPADVWNMFSAPSPREDTLWYYPRPIEVYDAGPPDGRRDLVVADLRHSVDRLRA